MWHERYLDPLPACDHATVTWRDVGDEYFTGERAQSGGYITGGPDGPIIYVRRGWDEGDALTLLQAHELAHWLMHCSGRWYGGDPAHVDGLVWPLWVPEIAGVAP